MMISCSSVIFQDQGKTKKQRMDTVIQSISDKKLVDYAAELSSEKYAGRLSGTKEYKKAAEWVASLFEKWNMVPAGDQDTYLRSFSHPYTIVFEGGELAYHPNPQNLNEKKYYKYEEEYYPGSESGSGALTAEVVYAGYGIYAPELNYNDYQEVDVKDKIVFIEPGVPVFPEENPERFKKWSHYSLNPYKVKMAVAQGAKAMLYHHLSVDPNTDYVDGFLVSQVGDFVAEDIFSGSGFSPREMREKIQNDLNPHSFETGKIFTIENLTEHHDEGTSFNVIGLMEGNDPELKDEVIIIGAHLDHVGFCYEIMPGANDNASGLAVMLGAAEALSKSPVGLRRSVMFIGFGAKEQGLIGSKEYLKDPVFPAEKTVLFINIDIVGNGNSLKVFGAEDFSDFWKEIRKSNKKNVGIELSPEYFDSLDQLSSDADSFLKKKIPCFSFRAAEVPGYIHTTRDTVDKLNPGIMKDLARLLTYFIIDLSQ
ncbi:MAG: M28 family peptidase [Acidobacteriota bacterium]